MSDLLGTLYLLHTISILLSKTSNADYLLTILLSIEQSLMGFSFVVKMEAGWMLKRVDDGTDRMARADHPSEFTATVDHVFAADTCS